MPPVITATPVRYYQAPRGSPRLCRETHIAVSKAGSVVRSPYWRRLSFATWHTHGQARLSLTDCLRTKPRPFDTLRWRNQTSAFAEAPGQDANGRPQSLGPSLRFGDIDRWLHRTGARTKASLP